MLLHHHPAFTGRMLFLLPNQQRQSTKGNSKWPLAAREPVVRSNLFRRRRHYQRPTLSCSPLPPVLATTCTSCQSISHLSQNGHRTQNRLPSALQRLGLSLSTFKYQLKTHLFQWSTSCWYGHVLRKEDNVWVKKCMEYEVEGARPRSRRKKTWRQIVEKDCQARKLKKKNAMDHKRWRKQIRDD